ncbi:MAG: glycosyltransferase family 4 protein [Akkermansiaceae bacterium]|nr:glycosyltransferase family 4 protein [Akkermansiaceae bacterium]
MEINPELQYQLKIPFFNTFYSSLYQLIKNRWNLDFRLFNPQKGHIENTEGITKKTALILWGDEYSQIFPQKYYDTAGAIIKCYCPESWERKGLIPMTDNAMIYTHDQLTVPLSCSKRQYTIMYSANLNYRRTDIFRGLVDCNFLYPFKISSNYPITGQYPFLHKVEAVIAHKIITRIRKERDFSHLYPNSYIKLHNGFMAGDLCKEEYCNRLLNSKISWCTAGFMTNETSRLLESAYAGCAIICGKLPNNAIYRGHPFYVINDWRKIRRVTDELLKDESRLDEMGYAARKWFDTHFNPQAQAERIASILLK